MTNLRVEDGAIFEDDRQVCNAEIAIENVYFSTNMRPAAARVVVRMSGMDDGAFVLDLEHLTFSALRQRMPLLRCGGPKDRQLLDAFLVEELQKKITYDAKNGRKPIILLEPSGIQQVGEHYTAVVGGQVIADELDYEVAVKQDRWKVPEPQPNMLLEFMEFMKNAPAPVLLTAVFVATSMVRSIILESGIDFQGLLYVSGPQGVGKTTLAKKLAGFVKNPETNREALFFDSSSTVAAIRDAMASARDLPIIIDDLCLSAGKNVQKKRIELGAQIVREASNAACFTKKSRDGSAIELSCNAGVIVTAEFVLHNQSDITRCIMAKVSDPLQLPDGLNAQLAAGAMCNFLYAFVTHVPEAVKRLREMVAEGNAVSALEECEEQRVRTNLLVLRWAFHELIEALAVLHRTRRFADELKQRFDEALAESVEETQCALEAVRSNIPEGNLAYIILRGYQNNDFHVLKNESKIGKLKQRAGIIWKGDLCLRPSALIPYIQRQNGYHDWSRNKIVSELRKLDVLCIQGEDAATVRLTKDKDVPRVYHFNMEMLEEMAEYY